MRDPDAGFSLIELLIVVALLSIIVTLSVGSYGRAVQRANRTDATRALLRIAVTQEHFYIETDRYAQSVEELGIADTSERGFYGLSIKTDDAVRGFRAHARTVPERRQGSDRDCTLLTIDATGAREPANCWR